MPAVTPAVIFKLVRDPFQHSGLAVARSLGRMGVPVYTAYRDAHTPASQSRYVTGRFVLHGNALQPARVLAALVEISARVGGQPVLIPLDDVAAGFVAERAADLDGLFRFPQQPPGLPARLSNKRLLDEMCRSMETLVPEARFPGSEAEFATMARELGFPVVLKSMDPLLLRSRPRAASVAIATDAVDALRLYRDMEVVGAPNFMLQEYIPGGATSVWMFNGYFDSGGTCQFAVTGQKLRQTPPDTGATSLGICRDNEAVRSEAIRFLRSLGYRGCVDMGYRYDSRDGSYRLLDVNPRVGSSFRLFVDEGGMDVVRALYLDMTGQPIRAARVHEGRRWVVEFHDLATSLKLFRRGRLGFLQWLTSFRGVKELAWGSRDDLRPAALMLLHAARDAASALVIQLFRPPS